MAFPFGIASKNASRPRHAAGIAGALSRFLSRAVRNRRGYAVSSATTHLPGLKLEALEPRYLMSADILPMNRIARTVCADTCADVAPLVGGHCRAAVPASSFAGPSPRRQWR